MPASRRPAATTFAPRSCPSRPTLATRMRGGRFMGVRGRMLASAHGCVRACSRIEAEADGGAEVEVGVRREAEAGGELAEDLDGAGVAVDAGVEREPEGGVVVPLADEEAGAVEVADVGAGAGEAALGDQHVALDEEVVVEVPLGGEVDAGAAGELERVPGGLADRPADAEGAGLGGGGGGEEEDAENPEGQREA